MTFFQDYQTDSFDNSLPIIRETFEDKKMVSNNQASATKGKPIEVRFMKPIGCLLDDEEEDQDSCHGRTRPTEIIPWWNPSNRFEKPPYTYATMIAHAILASKSGRLTLNDIYNWITETYPFYDLGDKGWQNSIRHNLSLKKNWFIKTDRKPTKSRGGRGGYWALQMNMEEFFMNSLSQTGKYGRKMSGFEYYVMDSTSDSDGSNDAINEAQNIQISRPSEDKKAKSPAPRIRNMSHDRSYAVPPPNTEPKSFVFRVDQPENNPRHFRNNTSRPSPKPGKRRKSAGSFCDDDDGNDSAIETEYQKPAKRNKTTSAMYQANDDAIMPSPVDFMDDFLCFDIANEFPYTCSTQKENIVCGLQAPVLESGIRTIDLQTDSFSKQVHYPMGFDIPEFSDPNGFYCGMGDSSWLTPHNYELSMPTVPIDNEISEFYWPDYLDLNGC